MRARMSEGPPAGKGTTILIDRVGNASGRSCAAAVPIIKAEIIANVIQRRVMASFPQSNLMPLSLITFSQRLASLRMKAENSSGVLVTG
jgi:hypothetical protein